MALCEITKSLPAAGGLFDQDPLWIARFEMWSELKGQKQELEHQKIEAKNRSKGPK